MKFSSISGIQNKQCTISFVVPCFNCEKTVGIAIESLLNQTYRYIQIVLVDDGSFDATGRICDEFAQKDERVVVIHQENQGLMRAWKNGVLSATGEYIAFCDSDDYFDRDFSTYIISQIEQWFPQLILFGMVLEYENGKKNRTSNLLGEGYYEREEIERFVLPNLFFNGPMQSELINKSRCDKVFKKGLLLDIICDLPDDISIGEDDVTTFLSVLHTQNILCLGEYYPYHYVRNSSSMIGKYDPETFEKINNLYECINKLANRYGYEFTNQILQDQFSTLLIFIKKECERNPYGYKGYKKTVQSLRGKQWFRECVANCSIKGYSFKSRVFATLIIYGLLAPSYLIVKILEN